MIEPTRTVYPCDEYGEVAVPISSLIREGELDIYPQVAQSAGYFDIDYKRGKLVLRATKYVGFIPISDTVAIDVRPRVPIASLLWMVARSGSRFSRLEGFIRGYQEQPRTIDSPEALYAEVFIAALERTASRGLLKRYMPRETDLEWRGRPLVSETVTRFQSKGYSYRNVFRVVEFTTDNTENRILKHTVRRLLQYLEHVPSAGNAQLAARAKRLITRLGVVDDSHVRPEAVARESPRLLRALARSHSFYEPALWLAYLIATRSGVAMERIGRARFESVIIDAATVFEKYVRTLCQEATARGSHFSGWKAIDGNRVPLPLFSAGRQAEVEPDIYFTESGEPVAVVDAKYKPDPGRNDRYELITFCEAAQVRRAAFVCPLVADTPLVDLYGETARGLSISLVRIDLAARDVFAEEAAFLGRLSAALVPTPAVTAG